jgi:hypothetical protein
VDIVNTSQLCWHVRDIWSRTDLGRFNGTFSASAVPPHGNRFLRLSAGAVCRVPSPPPAPACPSPAAAPAGFTVHPRRGWYTVTANSSNPVGVKGSSTVEACAHACVTAAEHCGAFHIYLPPQEGCKKGDCYIHEVPLGTFVPGNPNAFAYDREAADGFRISK